MGANAITHVEIQAWKTNTGRKPKTWEIGVIKQLDGIFLKHVSEETSKKRKAAEK